MMLSSRSLLHVVVCMFANSSNVIFHISVGLVESIHKAIHYNNSISWYDFTAMAYPFVQSVTIMVVVLLQT